MSVEVTVVINDILSFISCKLKQFSKLEFLKCLKTFYSEDEIDEALRIFLKALPKFEKDICNDLVTTKKDSLIVLYECFKNADAKSLPTFVCRDLNNLPKTDFSSNNMLGDNDLIHKSIIVEHNQIKSQISDALSAVQELRDEITHWAESRKILRRKRKKLEFLQKFVGESYEKKNLFEEETDEQDPLQLPNENIDESPDDKDGDDEDQSLRKDVTSHNIKTKRNVSEMHDDMFKSCSDLQKDDFIMPKVIHINSESEFPEGNSTNVISAEKNLAKVEINNSEELKEYYTDPFSFIDVEQVFDENVGHFSIYKCCLCNFSTNDHSAVGQHNCPQIYEENPRNHAEERNSKSFHFYCLYCRFKCNSKLLYNRHLQIHPQLFPCPFCKEERLNTENWKLHVKECVKKTVGKGSNHICKFCGIIYANSGALLVHKGFHDTAKPFECLKCHYRFYTEETLNRHFKAHLLNAFKCPFCHFTNKNKTTLLTHIRCHTGEMPFSCDFCDYRSSSQSALSSHQLCHTDKKTVKCEECNAFFKSIHKLNAHKITHSKNKIHKCPVCHKGFKTGWLMTIHHQRIHLNVRPYACKHCNYKARNLSALKSHFNTHSNEKHFRCSLCDFRANHKGHLKRHMVMWHPESLKNESGETDEDCV